MKKIKVALNMSKLSVPDKINRARHMVAAVLANPQVFVSPNPALNTVSSAIDDLEDAWNDAEDGGKTKTAIMHDKEHLVMDLLTQLALYVEVVANGDTNVIHLASMSIKGKPIFRIPDFSAQNDDDHGIRLRVKPAERKTIYRWEFCKDPMLNAVWQVGDTTGTSIVNLGPLDIGSKYWFRVVFISHGGESIPYEPVSAIIL